MKRLAVLVPAKDEEATIGELLDRLSRVRVRGCEPYAVVVDDGSTDGTARVARELGALVVRHEQNRGLGAAVRTGLRTAVGSGADLVAYLDADLEYRPEDVPRLVEPVLAGRADYVLGSRFLGGGVGKMKLHRWVGQLRAGVDSGSPPQGLRVRGGPDPLQSARARELVYKLALPGEGFARDLARAPGPLTWAGAVYSSGWAASPRRYPWKGERTVAGKNPYDLSATIWDSYREILEGTLAAQERNVELTLNVFESGMESLEARAEMNRRAVRELARRMREQREVYWAISRDSTEAYDGFLGSLSDYYKGVSEEGGREGRP